MEPLINPMYLYLISIVGKIYTVFSTLAVVFGFSSIFIIFASCVSTHNIKEDLEMFRKKPLKYVFIAALITGFVATVIPSEKTLIAIDFLYKMDVCTKKSEIHDLLEKNEIKINGETYNNPKYHIKIKDFINNIIGIEKRQERYYFHINNLKEKGIV